MLLKDIVIGKTYIAKVNGQLRKVRVDSHTERPYVTGGMTPSVRHTFTVTNLATGRRTTFRSPAKFRREAE